MWWIFLGLWVQKSARQFWTGLSYIRVLKIYIFYRKLVSPYSKSNSDVIHHRHQSAIKSFRMPSRYEFALIVIFIFIFFSIFIFVFPSSMPCQDQPGSGTLPLRRPVSTKLLAMLTYKRIFMFMFVVLLIIFFLWFFRFLFVVVPMMFQWMDESERESTLVTGPRLPLSNGAGEGRVRARGRHAQPARGRWSWGRSCGRRHWIRCGHRRCSRRCARNHRAPPESSGLNKGENKI